MSNAQPSSPLARKWPFSDIVPSIEAYYKQIQLYNVIDPSTWPFPVRKQNGPEFKSALQWLTCNNIDTIGTVHYEDLTTQTVHVKFTDNLDIVAFTLQFGDLLVR